MREALRGTPRTAAQKSPFSLHPTDPPARSLPLWPYCIFLGAHYGNYNGMFGICIAVTVLCMFGLGCGARTVGWGRRRQRLQRVARVAYSALVVRVTPRRALRSLLRSSAAGCCKQRSSASRGSSRA